MPPGTPDLTGSPTLAQQPGPVEPPAPLADARQDELAGWAARSAALPHRPSAIARPAVRIGRRPGPPAAQQTSQQASGPGIRPAPNLSKKQTRLTVHSRTLPSPQLVRHRAPRCTSRGDATASTWAPQPDSRQSQQASGEFHAAATKLQAAATKLQAPASKLDAQAVGGRPHRSRSKLSTPRRLTRAGDRVGRPGKAANLMVCDCTFERR
jgi:hypothetical protein